MSFFGRKLLIKIKVVQSVKKTHFKMLSAKLQPSCSGLDMLTILVLKLGYIPSQHHSCWCSGSLCRHVISNHPRGSVSAMPSQGCKWKYILCLKKSAQQGLTHWGRVAHICVSNLTTIGSDNGLSPGRRQAIIWTNAGILLIDPSWTNFSEILIEIPTFSFKKMRLKVSSAKWRPFCLGLSVLKAA